MFMWLWKRTSRPSPCEVSAGHRGKFQTIYILLLWAVWLYSLSTELSRWEGTYCRISGRCCWHQVWAMALAGASPVRTGVSCVTLWHSWIPALITPSNSFIKSEENSLLEIPLETAQFQGTCDRLGMAARNKKPFSPDLRPLAFCSAAGHLLCLSLTRDTGEPFRGPPGQHYLLQEWNTPCQRGVGVSGGGWETSKLAAVFMGSPY